MEGNEFFLMENHFDTCGGWKSDLMLMLKSTKRFIKSLCKLQ